MIVARALHVDEEKMYRDDPRWVSVCIITDKTNPLGFAPAYRYIFESPGEATFSGFRDFFAAEIDYFCSQKYTGISSLYSNAPALRKELIKLYYTNSLRYYRALIFCSSETDWPGRGTPRPKAHNDDLQECQECQEWNYTDRVYGDKLCIMGFFTLADMLQDAQMRTGIYTFNGCAFSLNNGVLHSECKNSPALIVRYSGEMARILEPYCDIVPPIDDGVLVYEWRKHGMRSRDDDLPSVTFSNGTMIWYHDDIINRATGPTHQAGAKDANAGAKDANAGADAGAKDAGADGPRRDSEGDRPALIGKHVSAWFDMFGCLHRAGAAAVVCQDGAAKMYYHGMLHGATDLAGTVGPAVTDVDGTKKWYRYNLIHADKLPAVVTPDGRQEYWCAGQHQCTV